METSANSASGRVSRTMRSTSSPVPTGTVDFVTITVKPSSASGDLARCLVDIGQIGMAVAAPRWRPDRDEDRVGLTYRLGEIQGEGEPARPHIVGDELGKTRLEDRHLAPLQSGDLARVLVDAGDHMAEIGKTCPGHEADIARSDHCDAHAVPSGSRVSGDNN